MEEIEVIQELKKLYKIKNKIDTIIKTYESKMYLSDNEKHTLKILKHLQSLYESKR